MLWNNRKSFLVASCLIGVAVIGGLFYFFLSRSPLSEYIKKADACAVQFAQAEEQIGCWYRVIEEAINTESIDDGMKVFSYVYENFTPFIESGCHRHAHKIGDIVYYGQYLANPDIDAIDFPQSTTACGYGFYHGFLEHLVQDNPDSAFVTDVCTTLGKKYGATMGDIQLTCYHGAGHGFMLAEIEKQEKQYWGNIPVFSKRPVELCNGLPEAREGDREECRQGIFNVIMEWGEVKNYGFSYEKEAPLAVCHGLSAGLLHACYYEAAQKFDGVAQKDLARAWRIAQAESPEHALMILNVAVAGVVQQTIADDSYAAFGKGCTTLPTGPKSGCIESIVNGLYEHGAPTEEFKRALAFCQLDYVQNDPDASEACMRAFVQRLPRFYTPDRIVGEVCPLLEGKPRETCDAFGE